MHPNPSQPLIHQPTSLHPRRRPQGPVVARAFTQPPPQQIELINSFSSPNTSSLVIFPPPTQEMPIATNRAVPISMPHPLQSGFMHPNQLLPNVTHPPNIFDRLTYTRPSTHEYLMSLDHEQPTPTHHAYDVAMNENLITAPITNGPNDPFPTFEVSTSYQPPANAHQSNNPHCPFPSFPGVYQAQFYPADTNTSSISSPHVPPTMKPVDQPSYMLNRDHPLDMGTESSISPTRHHTKHKAISTGTKLTFRRDAMAASGDTNPPSAQRDNQQNLSVPSTSRQVGGPNFHQSQQPFASASFSPPSAPHSPSEYDEQLKTPPYTPTSSAAGHMTSPSSIPSSTHILTKKGNVRSATQVESEVRGGRRKLKVKHEIYATIECLFGDFSVASKALERLKNAKTDEGRARAICDGFAEMRKEKLRSQIKDPVPTSDSHQQLHVSLDKDILDQTTDLFAEILCFNDEEPHEEPPELHVPETQKQSQLVATTARQKAYSARKTNQERETIEALNASVGLSPEHPTLDYSPREFINYFQELLASFPPHDDRRDALTTVLGTLKELSGG